ncbi:hypothetical protein [Sinorhizobium americanum]|uniref:Uncharacterized protein n=1 Tax=Sinorhizobium americanum TaxID=194963 RepID=A0A1L3LM36_9HYPH|nr:hypothetical protein [Sinorhizobium americanum]APG91160.1 hypothetical protein SAMCFNEI73_Ch1871 [Sinorhizobium americanum]OAP43736.1 hypothetical protein ATC00_02530 [Sinorhizobium americanum]
MGWVPDNVTEAMRGSHQLGLFLRIDTDPALHIYFGVNDIPIGFDSIDPDGTVYLGGGRLIGIPSLEVLVNGTSDAVDFTVSGIDPATGARMLDSIPPVRGKLVQIGLTTLDDYYQPMSTIIPIWTGIASHPKEGKPPIREGETATLALSLAVVAGENTRSRASRSLWSDAMQKAISPTDDFCKQTARLARGTQPVWPNY